MKHFFFLLCIVSLPQLGSAQSWDDIKASGDYIWGEGWGSTVAEADRMALADLISRIATHVKDDFDMGNEEHTHGQKTDQHTYVRSRLQTYSQATLTNAERITVKNEPDAVVGRYMKKTELKRIFESRQAKAVSMVGEALQAEADGKADVALRNYYWALALVSSLQYPNEAAFTDEEGQRHLLMNWIPEQMNRVFDDLKVTVKRRTGDDVELSVAFRGRPVASVDYTYFDGRDWSAINSANGGTGILELARGNQSTKYQLKFEYEYQSEAHIDKEIEAVLAVVGSRAMRKAYTTVDASAVTGDAFASNESFGRSNADMRSKPTAIGEATATDYGRKLDAVLAAVGKRQAGEVRSLFTTEGFDIFNRLLFKYGTVKLIGQPQPIFYNGEDGEVTARGVRASFAFSKGVRKSFVEDLVFTFDRDRKISNIAFGLGKAAEDDILNKGVWSERARKVLMAFLENYKTAYALKRQDYIETIFDDDAVIIVGHVAQRQKRAGDGQQYLNDKIVKLNRYSKDQYLKHLANCFRSNEFINIRFANNDVVKLGKGGESYGIQIAQDYYSSSYGDKGYLYLEVDVNNPKQPVIKVRTWQPEKDPEFGLYGPGDF